MSLTRGSYTFQMCHAQIFIQPPRCATHSKIQSTGKVLALVTRNPVLLEYQTHRRRGLRREDSVTGDEAQARTSPAYLLPTEGRRVGTRYRPMADCQRQSSSREPIPSSTLGRERGFPVELRRRILFIPLNSVCLITLMFRNYHWRRRGTPHPITEGK